MPRSIWTASSLAVSSAASSAQICKWCLGAGGVWGSGREGGEGPRGEGASERCHRVAALPARIRRGCGRSAAERAAEGRARGDAGMRFRGGSAAPGSGSRLSSRGSRCPEAARPALTLDGSPGRGSRAREGAPGRLEPSHKDAETAAAAAAVAAAERGRVLVQRSGGASPREEGPPARRHPMPFQWRHLPLPQHFRAGTG